MKTNRPFEKFETIDNRPVTEKMGKPADHRKAQVIRKQAAAGVSLQSQMVDDRADFPYSYKPSRFEGRWLVDSLGGFYEEHWFDDVLRMVKGGKEASVYLCRGNATTGSQWMAAKVYRPRMYRNLKDDHIYREGRSKIDESGLEITDDRAERAMAKRTNFGLRLMHTDWIQHEFAAMEKLYDAGAAIPRPFVCAHNAILMEYIGDEDQAAPTLNTVDLDHRSAARLFGKVVENLRLMLRLNLVHGDFSAYNLLYWEGEIHMIDFPQAFAPGRNSNAWNIFSRDVERVSEYFIRQGIAIDYRQLAESLWKEAGLAESISTRELEPLPVEFSI